MPRQLKTAPRSELATPLERGLPNYSSTIQAIPKEARSVGLL